LETAVIPPELSAAPVRNFGRNVTFRPRLHFTPRTEQDVLDLLDHYKGRRFRVVGRLHSWSETVVGEDVLLDLRHLQSVRVERGEDDGDGTAVRAVVGAGCQVKRLLAELRPHGLTLPAVGLITEQSIAGAIATGTHGSGRHSLSHYVEEVRLAVYDAESGQAVVRTVRMDDNDGDDLRAARCALGAMGVVLSVTVPCRPDYRVEEHTALYDRVEEVLAAETDYPLQQFYLIPWLWRFAAQHRRETTRPRSRLAWLFHAYWLLGIDVGLHWMVRLLARTLRRPGLTRSFFRRALPWLVIEHWRVADRAERLLVFENELFRHVEIELFVHRDRLPRALEFVKHALRFLGAETADLPESTRAELAATGLAELPPGLAGSYCHHYPICVRKVLEDDTLISMAAGEGPHYAISLISYQRPADFASFRTMASFMADAMGRLFEARPHWGKVCPLSAETAGRLYPRLERFRETCRRFDPDGVFLNDWVARTLGLDRPSPPTESAGRAMAIEAAE
jgi:FAD/FMN-containing dehydrogenase